MNRPQLSSADLSRMRPLHPLREDADAACVSPMAPGETAGPLSDVQTNQRKWTMKKNVLLVIAVLGLMVSVPATAGINYSQNFDADPAWASPLQWTAQSDYWGSSVYTNGSQTLTTGDPGYDTVTLSASRSFRTSGQLSSGESFSSVSLSGSMWNSGTVWNDGRLQSFVSALDDSGNGYVGLATYGGHTMYIGTVAAGVVTLQTGGNYNPPDFLVNEKTLALSIQNGVVSLTVSAPTLTTPATCTFNDTTYTSFTTIAFGCQTLNHSIHSLDNVVFSGTVVPEPALALPCLLGMLALIRKRR